MFVLESSVNPLFKHYIIKSKELIIKLIQQDSKHSQLVHGLEKVGPNGPDKYHLSLFELIYALMKVP